MIEWYVANLHVSPHTLTGAINFDTTSKEDRYDFEKRYVYYFEV